MKYCRKCGREIEAGVQYCPNCGNPVNDEEVEKNENSFQSNDTDSADETLWESFISFFKEIIRFVKEAGIGLIGMIEEEIRKEPNKPKDAKCPYCGSEDTFTVVKSELEVKSKSYSFGNGCCGMCLLGPFGLLCGLCGSGTKVNSKSLTWWGCKNCGKQHLTQHDAIEMMNSFMGKMVINCFCYGSLGSIFLYPILDGFVHGFLRTILAVLIAAIVGVGVPLYLMNQLFGKINKQLGYDVWEILEVEKKEEYWKIIKYSMMSLGITLVLVCPILLKFAE